MDWTWLISNSGTIISGMSFIGYVVASLSFIISMKTEMRHLASQLDRCELEIAELRKLVIDLVIGLTPHGKTHSQENQTTRS
jgi:hypothetical protein